MGGKHLKRLRTEKSKIKLKKKSLPKGQNVTDTTFKVKKILTVEQLKKVEKGEPVSSWNVPLKDLLIRLNHYNHTPRLNALNGIKELLANYQEILMGPSLKHLVGRVLDLLTDEEHKIRVMANEVLSYIFDCLPEASISPFHDILNVHLSCAMTHRSVSVQQDSLKFIDVLIKYAPNALISNVQFLLQNFTRIIKASLYGSHLDLQLKTSHQLLEKTKIEVFFRFYQFLSLVYSNKEGGKQCDSKIINLNDIRNKQSIHVEQLDDLYKKIPNLSSLFKRAESANKITAKFDPDDFKFQCSVIMPLLFDIWVEISPNNTLTGLPTGVLPENTGVLLCIITKILLLLHKTVVTQGDSGLESWLVSMYGSNFKKCFMSNFPFVPPVSLKKSQSSISPEFANDISSDYMKQNLSICYLSYVFKITQKNVELESKVEKFIIDALMAKKPTEVEILSKVVEEVIKSNKRKSDALINVVIKAHDATASSELRWRLCEILMKLVLQNEEAFQKNQGLSKWATSLPGQLLQSRISLNVVETISEIIKRPLGIHILKELESKAGEIVENLPGAKIEEVPEFEGQKMIINVLYWCDKRVLEELINKTLMEKIYPQPLRNYILNIFSYKLKCSINGDSVLSCPN